MRELLLSGGGIKKDKTIDFFENILVKNKK